MIGDTKPKNPQPHELRFNSFALFEQTTTPTILKIYGIITNTPGSIFICFKS